MFLFTYLCLLVLLVVWVALPLLPAILIYRLFPNNPLVVTGPLAGLTIKTGGAFAAYLIIFLIVKSQVDTTKDFIGGATKPYWVVSGEVSLVDNSGKEIEAIDLLDKVLNQMDVRTRPNILGHEGTTLRFKIPEETEGHLPKVLVYFPPDSGWAARDLPLDETTPVWKFWKWWDHKPTIDPFLKTIDIGKISIHQLPRPRTYPSTLPMDKGAAPVAQ